MVGDALDGLVDIGVADLGDRLFDRKALEIGQLDRGHDFDRYRVGQIGFAGENIVDGLFLGRHRDLGLGRQPKAALGENLAVGIADGLLHGFRHHRAAIDLLEVAHRHLARTKAVEANLVLEIDKTGVRLGIEIRCGNVDGEFVLQSLIEGLGDLHGVQSSSRLVRPERPQHGPSGRRRAWSLRRWFGEPNSLAGNRFSSNHRANAESAWCGRRDSNPHNFRHWNLNPARLPVPPRPLLASLSGRDAAGGGLITWARHSAAKK